MTATVDALHAALDETVADHNLRLVLADALEESEDPVLVALAPGYRALAKLGRYPLRWWVARPAVRLVGAEEAAWAYHDGTGTYYPADAGHPYETVSDIVPAPVPCRLPMVWLRRVTRYGVWTPARSTRRAAEDVAAAAFAWLTETQRARILEEAPCERQPT